MHGSGEHTGILFSYPNPDSLMPAEHPRRPIRAVVNQAPARRSADFAKLYLFFGRASISPEKLLRALLSRALFGIRSERQLMACRGPWLKAT